MDYYQIEIGRYVMYFIGKSLQNEDITAESLQSYMNDDIDKTDVSLSKIISKQERKKLNNSNMMPIFLDELIHDDDTVLSMKQKILHAMKKSNIKDFEKMYVEELYLYGTQQSHIDAKSMFQMLSSNGVTIKNEIFKKHVQNYVVNDKKIQELYDNTDDIDYASFLKFGFDKDIEKHVAVGISLSANEMVVFSEGSVHGNKRSLVENNRYLFEYKLSSRKIKCIPLQLHQHHEQFADIIPIYYPMLMQYNVENYADLKAKKNLFTQKEYNQINANLLHQFSNNELFYKYEDTKQITNVKIQTLRFLIRSKSNVILPIESIFKQCKTREDMPLIKFNPGKRKEYIFRLYSKFRTRENEKIPSVSKSVLRKYLVESRGKDNLYITFHFDINNNLYKSVNMNLFENGDIEYYFEGKKLLEEKEIVSIAKGHINDMLERLYSMDLPISYEFHTFQKLNDPFIMVTKLDYVFDHPFNGEWKSFTKRLNKIGKNMGFIFDLEHVTTTNFIMNFKKVSVYDNQEPKLIVSYNNKILSVVVSDVTDYFYYRQVMKYFSGMVHLIEHDGDLQKHKIVAYQDLDADTLKAYGLYAEI